MNRGKEVRLNIKQLLNGESNRFKFFLNPSIDLLLQISQGRAFCGDGPAWAKVLFPTNIELRKSKESEILRALRSGWNEMIYQSKLYCGAEPWTQRNKKHKNFENDASTHGQPMECIVNLDPVS